MTAPIESTRNVILIPDCTGGLHIGTCTALTDVVEEWRTTKAETGTQAVRQEVPSGCMVAVGTASAVKCRDRIGVPALSWACAVRNVQALSILNSLGVWPSRVLQWVAVYRMESPRSSQPLPDVLRITVNY